MDTVLIDGQLKLAVPGGESQGRQQFHQFLPGAPVGDDIGHADDFQSVLPGNVFQLLAPGHAAVLIHDLYQQGHWLSTGLLSQGQPRQVHAGLGMSRPLEYSTRRGHQREHMTRPCQILRLRIRIKKDLECLPAVLGGDAGGGIFNSIHADGKGSFVQGGIPVYHGRQSQLLGPLLGKRYTDKSPPIAHHEVDVFRAGLLRQHDEIPLILTLLIIRDDYHLADP
ncbi:hypothetical protein ES703_16025 [subsurface metagenome]